MNLVLSLNPEEEELKRKQAELEALEFDLIYYLVIDRRKQLEKKNNPLKIQFYSNNYITNKI